MKKIVLLSICLIAISGFSSRASEVECALAVTLREHKGNLDRVADLGRPAGYKDAYAFFNGKFQEGMNLDVSDKEAATFMAGSIVGILEAFDGEIAKKDSMLELYIRRDNLDADYLRKFEAYQTNNEAIKAFQSLMLNKLPKIVK